MTNFSYISLPDSARDFLETIWVPSGLCARMLSALRTQGKLSAVLPEGTPPSRAEQYKAGGIAKGDETRTWLAQHICSAASGVLLIQDLWMAPKNYGAHTPFSDFWIHDGDISYLGADVKPGAEESVRTCLYAPSSFYYVGFLIAGGVTGVQLEAGNPQVDELAPEIVEMIVPAYDQEGFILWTR
jgi:hypothetical protein